VVINNYTDKSTREDMSSYTPTDIRVYNEWHNAVLSVAYCRANSDTSETNKVID